MIRTQSFTHAAALYQGMMDLDVNRILIPVPNTPVSMLTAPVIAPALFFDAESADYQSVSSITSLLERNAVATEAVDEHQQTADELTRLAGEAVRNTVKLTKTVALPVISSITEKLEQDMDTISGCAGLALTITPEVQTDILTSSVLQNALEDFTQVAREDTPTVNAHMSRTVDDLLGIIKVGHQDFDQQVARWIEPFAANGLLLKIYTTVFGGNAPISNMGSVFAQNHKNYPDALICFLLCRYLMQHMDEGINLSASAYESRMSMVLNYAAITLRRATDTQIYQNRRKLVVLRWPAPNQEGSFRNPEKGVILVHKGNYARFLEAGGSPEIIMGAYLSTQVPSHDGLLEDSERYLKAYNARVKKLGSDNELAKLLTLKRNLERYISDELARTLPEVVGADRGVWQGIELNPEAAQRKLRAAIDQLSYHNLTEIYVTVRKVLVAVCFADTDVEQLLTLIDNNASKTERDLQSAVNLAILDYIVDWLMQQTKLTRA